jgi:two-component system sensor histidine kinase YesM
MPRGSYVPSLTLRLFSTIVLGFVAVNIITLYITSYLKDFTRTSILREYRQVQEMYADEVTRQLTQAQERISILGSSYLVDMGTNAEALQDERQYEAVRCQNEINSAMKNWQFQYPAVTGYYVYGQTADVFIFGMRSNNYQSSTWFRQQLENKLEPFTQIGGWRLWESPMGQLLIFNVVRRDLCYGSWIQVDALWDELGLNESDVRTFDILPAETEAPSSGYVIDVPIEDTTYIIRQTLAAEAVALPRTVQLLQLLAYLTLLIIPLSWLALRRLVFSPLRELTTAIQEIDRGNTKYRIPTKATSYEFDQLNRQFNRSIEAVANAEAKAYASQLESERIRIRYLTQQMQPHFVLNTLNLVYSMEPDQYPLMVKTLLCLSRYFRYIAHISEPMVPVEAELEHVKNYFQLQQIRYPDNFTYDIQCPEELREMLIPPIVIQTFAENAIKHSLIIGVMNHVEVHIQLDDERLHISIHDTGTGYPDEVLERIRIFQQTRERQEGLGLGIQNTIERLELLYGHNASLSFCNAPKGGAQVDILLPKARSKREAKMS